MWHVVVAALAFQLRVGGRHVDRRVLERVSERLRPLADLDVRAVDVHVDQLFRGEVTVCAHVSHFGGRRTTAVGRGCDVAHACDEACHVVWTKTPPTAT